MINYWSDPKHREWDEPYIKLGENTFLEFTKEWRDVNLPITVDNDILFCEEPDIALFCAMLDTVSGKVHTIPVITVCGRLERYDQNGDEIMIYSLCDFFYSSHYCQCHRLSDIETFGRIIFEPEFECKGNRFLIESIKPVNSDLILYSETIPMEELNKQLRQTKEITVTIL